jgi:probable addiction module antidote protein
MPLETRKWDVTEYLDTDERVVLFLEAAFEDGDPAAISAAIGEVARSRGMTNIARDAGLSRENLYKALSETGNPEFSTILKVVNALGFSLTIAPHKHEAAA